MKHGSITHQGAAPDFFEGDLLGNGGLGAVVTTRPDAVVIHFGHNEVWDIRVEEGHAPGIGTFAEVFAKVAAIDPDLDDLTDDPWFAQYNDLVKASYDLPFPRPFPCGSLILGLDPRRVEVVGHRLDLATATCTISLLANGERVEVEVFVAREDDRLWVSQSGAAVFDRIKLLPDPVGLIPDPRTGAIGPAPEVLPAPPGLAFRQVLPSLDPAVDANAFVLTATTNAVLREGSRRGVDGRLHPDGPLERTIADSADLRVVVTLAHGIEHEAVVAGVIDPGGYSVDRERTTRFWSSYWQASAVELADELLTELWYRNSYFLACASGLGKTCPGLFGPWSYRRIGSDWHGDYHLNYNVQQPLGRLLEQPLRAARALRVHGRTPAADQPRLAGQYYGLRGAAFPHSAYPVPMATNPYPDPSWGWEVCETPWAVQSLWWHYLYTRDLDYLRQRAFGPLKEATLFFVDYVLSSSDRGTFDDGKLHVFPTVTPELYGLRPGFRYNADCVVDLALGRFLLDAFTEAAQMLERSDDEAELLTQVQEVLHGLVDYPLAESRDGQVVVSTPGEDPAIVYNVPVAAVPAFPAEQGRLRPRPGPSLGRRDPHRRRVRAGRPRPGHGAPDHQTRPDLRTPPRRLKVCPAEGGFNSVAAGSTGLHPGPDRAATSAAWA